MKGIVQILDRVGATFSDSIRCQIPRLLPMVLTASAAVLLLASLLGKAASTAQATPPLTGLPFCNGAPAGCDKTDNFRPSPKQDSLFPEALEPLNPTVHPIDNDGSIAYTFQFGAASNKVLTGISVRPVAAGDAGLVIEPDYVRFVHPGTSITLTHWLTNLGDYTDTIQIEAFPSIPWPISPPSVTLAEVGAGHVRAIPVIIEVPSDTELGIENRIILSATSTTGPASDIAEDIVIVSPWRSFLPLLMKPYVSPDPFCNGDFSDPLAPCWTSAGNLSVERLCSSGRCFARLAKAQDDSKCSGQLTPGNAALEQTFIPAATGNATLNFRYEIHTQDVLSELYDTLEVYVDDTLRFRVVKPNPDFGCDHSSMVMSGTESIPISLVRGNQVTVKFLLMQSDAWFNTYTNIRDVQVTY